MLKLDKIHLMSDNEAGCSLGIRDQRILCLLHRIPQQNFACFLREICCSKVILVLLYSILMLPQFLMKTLIMEIQTLTISSSVFLESSTATR